MTTTKNAMTNEEMASLLEKLARELGEDTKALGPWEFGKIPFHSVKETAERAHARVGVTMQALEYCVRALRGQE